MGHGRQGQADDRRGVFLGQERQPGEELFLVGSFGEAEADGPGPYRRAGVGRHPLEVALFTQAVDGGQRPQQPQANPLVRGRDRLPDQFAEPFDDIRPGLLAGLPESVGVALLEEPPGRAGVPVVVVKLVIHQLGVGGLGQVDTRHRLGVRVADLVDAAVGTVPDLRLGAVADLLVVPVEQVDVAVRPALEGHGDRPAVVGQQEVGVAVGLVATALGADHVDVEAVAVQVTHEEFAVVLLGPGAALVAHQAAVGVAAAGRVAAVVAGVGRGPDVVSVQGDRLDVGVGVRVEVAAGLPVVAAARDDVPHVRDDARLDEEVAVGVVVEAPRVAGAVGDDLEDVPRRVIAPDAGVNLLSLVVRVAGLADVRVREDAVAAVQPAVRPPDEAVERLVGVLPAPAIEEDLRFTGLVGLLVVRDEEQVGGGPDPHPAEADLDAAGQVQPLEEDGPLVVFAVAVGVLEDDDLVAEFTVGDHRAGVRVPPRVGVCLKNPQPAAVVDRERDRLVHVRLGGEHGDGEARRHGHRLGRVLRLESGKLVGVDRRGRLDLRPLGEARLLGMEAEVVEVDVAPVARVLIDQPDEDLAILVLRQIDDDPLQVLGLATRRPEDHVLAADDLDARFQCVRPAADQEAGPGVRHRERHTRERSGGLVAELLVAADPELALVPAPHIGPAGEDGVALDRLALEGFALGGPVLECAGLEVEVQWLTVGPEREDADVVGLRIRGGRLLGRDEQNKGEEEGIHTGLQSPRGRAMYFSTSYRYIGVQSTFFAKLVMWRYRFHSILFVAVRFFDRQFSSCRCDRIISLSWSLER